MEVGKQADWKAAGTAASSGFLTARDAHVNQSRRLNAFDDSSAWLSIIFL
jgi:hypothetical protein